MKNKSVNDRQDTVREVNEEGWESVEVHKSQRDGPGLVWTGSGAVCGLPLAPALLQTPFIINEALQSPGKRDAKLYSHFHATQILTSKDTPFHK